MNLFDRVKNIIASPNREWDVIAAEQPDASKIITGYVLPLAGIAAIAAFIGYGLMALMYLGFALAVLIGGYTRLLRF